MSDAVADRAPGRRSFPAYITAVAADGMVSSMLLVLLAWYVARAAGHLWLVSVALGVETLPRAVFLLFGGAIADRRGALSTARWTLSARLGVVILFLMSLMLPGSGRFWGLVAAALLYGVLDVVHLPAIEAVRASLTTDPDLQAAVTGTAGSALQIAEVVGAPLAGVLISIGDIYAGLVSIVLIVIAMVTLGRVRVETQATIELDGGFFSSVVQGARFAAGSPTLLASLGILCAGNAVATAPLVAGVPIKAEQHHWSGVVFGFVSLGFALGAAAGSWISGRPRAARARSITGALMAMVAAGCSFIWLSLSAEPAPVMVAAVLGGVFCSFAARVLITGVTTQTPLAFQGRIQALVQASIFVGIPVGYGVFALLTAAVGPRAAGTTMSSGLCVIAVGAFVLARARRRRRTA